MTDDDVINRLRILRDHAVEWGRHEEVAMYWHAIVAIQDRAAVVALYDEDGGGTVEHAEKRLKLHFAIERHMRGEP